MHIVIVGLAVTPLLESCLTMVNRVPHMEQAAHLRLPEAVH